MVFGQRSFHFAFPEAIMSDSAVYPIPMHAGMTQVCTNDARHLYTFLRIANDLRSFMERHQPIAGKPLHIPASIAAGHSATFAVQRLQRVQDISGGCVGSAGGHANHCLPPSIRMAARQTGRGDGDSHCNKYQSSGKC